MLPRALVASLTGVVIGAGGGDAFRVVLVIGVVCRRGGISTSGRRSRRRTRIGLILGGGCGVGHDHRRSGSPAVTSKPGRSINT